MWFEGMMWRRDGDGGDGEVALKRGEAGQKWQEGGAEQSEFLSARMREGLVEGKFFDCADLRCEGWAGLLWSRANT